MYRLLIADDEALEREGLEWIVQRMMPDTFEVLHAENGRMAIEQAEEHRPHIILMDVHMPGIQGLAALREIKERLPDTKMVLVTAYDYFAYAKEALSIGVKEYIVKPANREQVVRTLSQLVDELDQEKRKRSEELELRDKLSQLQPMMENELALMFMVDQVLDTGAEQLAEWLDFPLDHCCSIVIAFSDAVLAGDKKKIYDTFRSFAKTQENPAIISSVIDRHLAIFLRQPPSLTFTDWLEKMKLYGAKLISLAERQLNRVVSIGIGSARRDAEGLKKSYYEAVFASTYFEQAGKVCLFDELKGGAQESARSADSNPLLQGGGPNRSYVLSALQRIREEREQQTFTALDRAKRYIQERYAEDLSLEEVAEFVHLNPHYFSKIFKQQVGDTFIDFVTGLRIEKAKALIQNEELSLKEVCFEVGYKDPNYFSRVFKKTTGVTPTEYRAQIK